MNKKRILSALLAVCMVFSMALCIRTDVYARSTESIKIVFDGKKAVTLNSGSEPETISQVEEKWGKATRMADKEEYDGEAYVWEKGKTFICIQEVEGGLNYIALDIRDKNSSVAGVKAGMKKDKAMKKLRKIYGKKNVKVDKINPGSDDECNAILAQPGGYLPIIFELKNNKVVSIGWWRF